ncbi:putative Protein kinase [Quillaja saponaria]|uniref:non-specific serine/threonine protein kinase n=1 Tax=Quillaja saponaria TaxID=32244 RepID=A0AAD7LRN0_QUISA|nr:putative Protein kinase [Quillaja saponaria]
MKVSSHMVNQLLIFLPLIIALGNLTVVAPKTKQLVHKKIDNVNQSNDRGFISIDCGATEEYRDEITGIWSKPDTDFVQGGRIYNVNPPRPDSFYERQLSTLRSFPVERRSCYTLRPKQGKDNKYFIRAAFFHGGYDSNTQSPSFDLYLGANLWTRVPPLNASKYYIYDRIHTTSTDTINVCLVNNGGGAPFISSLELRPASKSSYGIASHSLELDSWFRQDAGASNLSFNSRYKDDVYDRFWSNYNLAPWWSNYNLAPWRAIGNKSIDIDTEGSSDAYRLPAQVLRTAAQPATLSKNIFFNWTFDMHYEYCVYFHFAEIQFAPGQRRMINITVNGENFLSEPITLQYSKPLTISPNITTRGYVTFNITPAVGSALPPILNAFEIYRLTPQPNLPTDTGDVDAILEIKGIYGISRINWQGDPCLPSFLMWNGLNCSYGSSPRIVSVDLSSSKLTGEISSSFSRLTELESLDLSYNELTGSLPEFLGEMPKLTMLNLTGNRLTGPIPQALLQKWNKTLLLSLGENPSLGWTGSRKKPKFVVPLVASTSVLVLLILGALVIIWKLKSIRGVMITKSKKGVPLKSKNRAFTYSEVVSITDNFQTTIGEGGFGKVYLGTIQDNIQVAVKLLSSSSMQGYKEFRSEAQLLMIVHHRNLVSLVGYCDEGDTRALIYEYMSNGNLHHQLSAAARNVPKILPWNRRLQIAVDAAQGLDYLHNGCKPPIIHRDMKTSNILLDDKMQAKISDFGLSTAFTNDSDSYISTNPAGTVGYLDPEFHSTGNLNKKSDVYSFGIILLELITGQPVLGKATDENNHHILNWVIPKIENGDVQNVVDPRLQGEFNINTAWKIVEIAMSCTPRSAIQRPDISLVLSELKECLALEMVHDQNDGMDSLKIESQISEVSAR